MLYVKLLSEVQLKENTFDLGRYTIIKLISARITLIGELLSLVLRQILACAQYTGILSKTTLYVKCVFEINLGFKPLHIIGVSYRYETKQLPIDSPICMLNYRFGEGT